MSRDAYDISKSEIEAVYKKNRMYCADKLYHKVIYVKIVPVSYRRPSDNTLRIPRAQGQGLNPLRLTYARRLRPDKIAIYKSALSNFNFRRNAAYTAGVTKRSSIIKVQHSGAAGAFGFCVRRAHSDFIGQQTWRGHVAGLY